MAGKLFTQEEIQMLRQGSFLNIGNAQMLKASMERGSYRYYLLFFCDIITYTSTQVFYA